MEDDLIQRIEFLGCPMDVATIDDTVTYICERVKKDRFTQHVVVNVAKLVYSINDPMLRDAIVNCEIINIDGMGVVWGARFIGYDIPERVAGIDLFYRLLDMSSKNKFPVFLLGARHDVLDKVVDVLHEKFPSLIIAGYHHGYFWDNEKEVVNQVHQSGAKLLFVAISSPKKEIFINKWKEQLGVDFVMGVGGTFDVVAGKVKRAPEWMQKSGLEWLFRLLQEPNRMWKRYFKTNLIYISMLVREKLRRGLT